MDADGFTYIVDRKKEMIKYKGFGIAPAELESLLMEHPAVMDSAVIGIPDAEAGELPKGFVVIRKGFTVTPEEIVAFANGKLRLQEDSRGGDSLMSFQKWRRARFYVPRTQ